MITYGNWTLVADTPTSLASLHTLPAGHRYMYIYIYQATGEPQVLIGTEELAAGSVADTPVESLPIIQGTWHPIEVHDPASMYLMAVDTDTYVAYQVVSRSVS